MSDHDVCWGGERINCPGPDVLAFVDSDACPHVDWLGRLVERIASGKNAVATGYRWYVPTDAGLCQPPAFGDQQHDHRPDRAAWIQSGLGRGLGDPDRDVP